MLIRVGETLVEIFPGNKVELKLVKSGKYDNGCDNLPAINLTELLMGSGS